MSPTPNRRRPEPKGKMKIGICENHNYTDPKTDDTGDCPKCASGERIKVEVKRISDFRCPVCGEKLTPVKTGVPKWVWLVGAAVVSAIIITVICLAMGGESEKGEQASEPTVATDTIAVPSTDSIVVQAATTEPTEEEQPTMAKKKALKSDIAQPISSEASGVHKLSYGTWKGGWKNGMPHGNGTLTYSVTTVIDNRDSKGRTAQPGEYVIGEWDNGHLVQGRWFKNDNSKEVIIIGKAE